MKLAMESGSPKAGIRDEIQFLHVNGVSPVTNGINKVAVPFISVTPPAKLEQRRQNGNRKTMKFRESTVKQFPKGLFKLCR